MRAVNLKKKLKNKKEKQLDIELNQTVLMI